jgi:hypothetical protein
MDRLPHPTCGPISLAVVDPTLGGDGSGSSNAWDQKLLTDFITTLKESSICDEEFNIAVYCTSTTIGTVLGAFEECKGCKQPHHLFFHQDDFPCLGSSKETNLSKHTTVLQLLVSTFSKTGRRLNSCKGQYSTILPGQEDYYMQHVPIRRFASDTHLSRLGIPELDTIQTAANGRCIDSRPASFSRDRWIVRHYSVAGSIVVESNMESGTLLLASVFESRHGIGVGSNDQHARVRLHTVVTTMEAVLKADGWIQASAEDTQKARQTLERLQHPCEPSARFIDGGLHASHVMSWWEEHFGEEDDWVKCKFNSNKALKEYAKENGIMSGSEVIVHFFQCFPNVFHKTVGVIPSGEDLHDYVGALGVSQILADLVRLKASSRDGI